MTWGKGKSSKNPDKLRRWPRRTHTTFDGYGTGMNLINPVQNQEVSAQSSQLYRLSRFQDVPKTLFIISLIEELCAFYEKDPHIRKILFNDICKNLSSTRIIDPTFTIVELDHITPQFRRAFYEIVHNARLSIHKVLLPSDGPTVSIPRPLPFNGDSIPINSRYAEEFEELEVIGEGGFGIVCKVKKRLDQCLYAVKKIQFKYRNSKSIHTVLREVELLAKLNHPNVVAYKTAWIESRLTNSGSASPISSSGTNSPDVYMKTAYERGKLSTNKSEGDSIIFMNEENEGLQENIQFVEGKMNAEYLKIDCASNCNSYITNSSLSVFEKRYTFNSVSIKEITSSTELANISISDAKIEEKEELLEYGSDISDKDGETDAYDETDFPSGGASRHRHGSGATCRSHSDSEVDDVLTVQRRSSCIDITELALARCVSFDDTCKILPIFPDSCNADKSSFLSWSLQATLYVQMELCSESLRDWLDEKNQKKPISGEGVFDKVSDKEVMFIFRQVLKGVDHIHSHGLIHRDLKPQNIFFDCTHSKVKIGDFGLAVCYSDTRDACSPFVISSGHSIGVGTTPYAAPEQRAGCMYDPMADMFSLGIILVELLHPFSTGMERAECLEKLCDGIIPDTINKRPELAKVIKSLLNKEPKLRPSAKDILNSSLFFSKSQIIENLKKEVQELQCQLKEKNREIVQLKKYLLQNGCFMQHN